MSIGDLDFLVIPLFVALIRVRFSDYAVGNFDGTHKSFPK